MSGPKGIVSDLTSINSILGSINDQIDSIFSKAGETAPVVNGVLNGGSGTPTTLGVTKKGSGANSLGLANVPSGSGGSMSGPNGVAGMLDEVKFSGGSMNKTSTGGSGAAAAVEGETAADASMGGWAGAGGGAMKALGWGATAVGALATGAAAVSNMMPDVGSVIDRGASYYHAGVMQGNMVSQSAMASNAQRNGLGYTGMSGQIVDYLSSSGVNYGTGAWNTTSQEVANASRYLNMDPMAAAQAYTNLNSGTTSANLMRTMGIMTSDTQGNSLSAENIFDQIDSRLMQPGTKYSKSDVLESWQKGGMQQSLAAMGLTSDQASLYENHLIAKVTGQPSDMSKSATLDDLTKQATGAGNANPMSSSYQINNSQDQLAQSYLAPYIQGIKDAVPLIKSMNDWLGQLPPSLKSLKATLDTLAGNKGTGGAINGATNLVGNIVEGVLAGLGIKSGAKLISNAVKSTAKTAEAADKGATTAAKAGSTASKAAEAGKAATAGADALSAAKLGKLAATASAVSKVAAPVAVATDMWQFRQGAESTNSMTPAQKGKWANDAGNQYNKEISDYFTANSAKNGPFLAFLNTLSHETLGGGLLDSAGKELGANAPWAVTPIKVTGGGNVPFKGLPPHGGPSSTVGTAAPGVAGGAGKISFILPWNGQITDVFGPRKSPGPGASTFHRGIDIAGAEGSVFWAAADGVVSFTGAYGTGGNATKINHGGGYVTIYMHQPNGGFIAQVGQAVKQHQPIGHIGHTGDATGPHVHFQLELNGTAIDPMPLLDHSINISTPPTGGSDNASTPGSGQQQAQNAPNRLILNSGAQNSQSGIIASVSQAMPQFASASPQGFGSMSAGSQGIAAPLTASSMSGYSSGVQGKQSASQASMSAPGAGYFKQGDDYVSQDSHVNVHAGEAILTEADANEWRAQKAGVGKRSPTSVKIYLTIQDASDTEARKFANRVKQYIQEDQLVTSMGSR